MHHEASESLDFATASGNNRTSVDVADDKKIIINSIVLTTFEKTIKHE